MRTVRLTASTQAEYTWTSTGAVLNNAYSVNDTQLFLVGNVLPTFPVATEISLSPSGTPKSAVANASYYGTYYRILSFDNDAGSLSTGATSISLTQAVYGFLGGVAVNDLLTISESNPTDIQMTQKYTVTSVTPIAQVYSVQFTPAYSGPPIVTAYINKVQVFASNVSLISLTAPLGQNYNAGTIVYKGSFTADDIESEVIALDTYIAPANLVFTVQLLLGTSVDVSIQHTNDNIFAANYSPATGNWESYNAPPFNPTVTLNTSNPLAEGVYAFCPRAIRVIGMNPVGSPAIEIAVSEAGIFT